MAPELTSTAKAILGMVGMGTTTGYEIKQLVDKSSRYFWAASYGQIYPELRRLEEAGLLAGEDDPRGGRSRRAYQLTADGKHALHEWLTSDEDLILELRDEGMLKLFFAAQLSEEEMQALLRRKVEQHERIAAQLHAIEPAVRAGDDCPYLVLDYGIAFHEWTANWYRELAKRLADGR
jgi:PadR family transcriptional regulator AphA